MSDKQLFSYYLFGIYIIELGRFFKGVFHDFQIQDGADHLQSQVYFGAPRAAFRYYMEQFNGLIKLPMINYNISNTERKTEFERIVYLHAISDNLVNPNSKGSIMRYPSVYEITYQCDMWNNNLRERDYMMHKLITKMPMGGDAWLQYYPDRVNYPDVYLPMAHRLDVSFKDETELDNLDVKETRDKIRTSFTITCTRAFVPYEIYDVPVISWINLESYINELNGNIIFDEQTRVEAQALNTLLLELGLSATNMW
ncbi:MAG TPA: hypothetical protein PK705_07405 [Clostridia bacterium]|nr:hypothetical protein [Clostridia bacterium]